MLPEDVARLIWMKSVKHDSVNKHSLLLRSVPPYYRNLSGLKFGFRGDDNNRVIVCGIWSQALFRRFPTNNLLRPIKIAEMMKRTRWQSDVKPNLTNCD